MPDARFFQTGSMLSVEDVFALARQHDADARLIGASKGAVARVAGPDESDISDAIVFCARDDIAEQLAGCDFRLVIACAKHVDAVSAGGPVIETASAKRVFAAVASVLHSPRTDDAGAPTIGAGVTRHPTTVIGARAEIGDGCTLGPHAVIGPGVKLGEGCVIGAASSVYFSILGDRVRLLSGARLGEDGFGFVEGTAGAIRVPQLGRLIVGDDVEIGANTAIDRGALGDTVIGAGTKIDNLVHIAHNVQIGQNCLIAGQVGFAGSCELGDGVVLGGQAGVADHIKIGAGANIAAQAGLLRNVPAGETWSGTPAMPLRVHLRAAFWAARQSRKKAGDK